MIKKIALISIILICILCSGCGFRMRSVSSFPQPLHSAYFSVEKRYSLLSIAMNQLFHSTNVCSSKSEMQSRFTVALSNDFFTHSEPDIVDTTLPTYIDYSQSALISIIDNANHQVIASKSFTTTQSLTLNTNQIYTNTGENLIRDQITHQMISLIYYWLSSTQVKTALQHAITAQKIKRAS
jgi:hypothetical protein